MISVVPSNPQLTLAHVLVFTYEVKSYPIWLKSYDMQLCMLATKSDSLLIEFFKTFSQIEHSFTTYKNMSQHEEMRRDPKVPKFSRYLLNRRIA